MQTQDVVISDSRKEWMKKEDVLMLCWTRCQLYKVCSSRFGPDCKHLGGDKIPKLRGN